MRGRIKEDDSGVPTPDGPFAYLWKYRQGGQHELIGRTPRDGGETQLVLDGDAIRQPRRSISTSARPRHSPDHRLLAWSADLRGSEYFTIRCATGRPARICRTSSNRPAAAWSGAPIRRSSSM
jgi:oligopeptidase B